MTKIGWRWAHKLCGKTSSAPIPKLPDDVIIDILSRLSVKTLLRLKCVCKSWHTFISSTHFAKLHIKKTHNADDYANHRVVLLTGSDHFRKVMMSFPLRSILKKSSRKTTWLNFPYNNMNILYLFVSSYNGLICFVTTDVQQIMLWNPSSGQCNAVLVDDNKDPFSYSSCYGFYYDENSDEYKIVVIYNSFIPVGFVAKLWSSRTNSWTNIQEGLTNFRVMTRSGVAVNGKLHWTSCENFNNNLHGNSKYTIHALDFKTERFADLALPDIYYNNGYAQRFPTLAVFRGLLCIVKVCEYFLIDDIQMGIWVMKEYGVKESWTKVFALPRVRCPWPRHFEKPTDLKYTLRFCIMGNNELIFLRKRKFRRLVRVMSQLPFHPIKHTYTGDRHVFYFILPTFVESLVSPRAGLRQERSEKGEAPENGCAIISRV